MLQIIKRNGSNVSFNPTKIYSRIKKAAKGMKVNADEIFVKVITSMPTEGSITTTQLDDLIAKTAAPYIGTHPDYSKLASAVSISSFHKSTNENFYDNIKDLTEDGVLSPELLEKTEKYGKDKIQALINYERDYEFDYFAWKTLHTMYLLKDSKGVVKERPQQMYMRIAIWVTDTFEEAKIFYELLSKQLISCATPIMINSGTKNPQLASCFHEDTKVFVKDKGSVRIKDVEVGDFVITHKNEYRKVLRKFENKIGDRKIVKFNTHGSDDIVCTDNHKFFSISKEQLSWGIKEGSWNEISYLRTGDFIKSQLLRNDNTDVKKIDLLPFFENKNYEVVQEGDYIQLTSIWEQNNGSSKTSFKNKRTCGKIRRFINLDEITCKLIGMWYGDGSVIRKKGKPQGLNIISDVRHKEIIDFLPIAFEHAFGLKVNIEEGKKKCDYPCEWKTFKIYSTPLAEVFIDIFGAYFSGKKIPNIIYELPSELAKDLIAGIITADGCITKSGRIIISMKNKKFIEDLFYLAKNNGIKVSKGKNNKGTHSLYIPQDNDIISRVIEKYNDGRKQKLYSSQRIVNSIELDGEIYYRIENKAIIRESPDYVYNMEVEEHNSYCVEGIVAKNCVLHFNDGDSREGLLKTFNDVSNYSSNAAGIGLCMSNIRSRESKIQSSGGNAGGLLKYLKIVNEGLRFFNQQGRRPGSAGVYIEPWHKDIFDFLDIKKNTGAEELRARDIFTALFIPDLFMKTIKEDGDWYLFCPNDIRKAGLKPFHEIYGEEFEEEYYKAVALGIGKKIKAKDVLIKIYESQVETGVPYIAYKDHANRKTNHMNIGTIKQSNLCLHEGSIVEVIDENNEKQVVDLQTLKAMDIEGQKLKILSFNEETLENEWQDVLGVEKTSDTAELIKITDEETNKYILCTPEHKIYTNNRGYVMAKDLKEDDNIKILFIN